MKKNEIKICPICKKYYSEFPALSRKNNINICPNCGIMEAIEDIETFIEKSEVTTS